MASYGTVGYWEDRYRRDPDYFDWFQRYAGLKELFSKYLRKGDAILNIGCGSSRLSEEMYDDGYSSIANIDFAAPVIEQMTARNKDKKGLSWQVMDATALTFPDHYYDAVVAKATFDSILCGENSTANAAKLCTEVSRVLKPGGNFVIVSYGQPESRLTYLEKEEYRWRVTVHTVAKPTIAGAPVPDATDPTAVHYVYVCHKVAS